MHKRGLILAGMLLASWGLPSSSADAAPLPRVMSIEVCASQYILALADREQIISLVKGTDDPRISFLHDKARGIPTNRRSAEEVVTSNPDLVFTGPFSRRTRQFLKRFDVKIVRTKRPKTISELTDQIRSVAKILGHPERGENMAQAIDEQVSSIKDNLPAKRPTGVIYRGNGYSFGADTLVDAIMAAAGIENIVTKLGYKRGGYVPLEILLVGRPDLMLDDSVRNPMRRRIAAQILQHPALERSLPNAGRVEFPVAFWLCGGRSTPVAIETLASIVQNRADQRDPK